MESEDLKEFKAARIVGHRAPNKLMVMLEELRRTLNAEDSMVERYWYFINNSKFGTDCSFAIRAERVFEDGRDNDPEPPEDCIMNLIAQINDYYRSNP